MRLFFTREESGRIQRGFTRQRLIGRLMMAASAGNSSVLEEELTCPVCLDLYRDPHLLPCGHNFCLPCLRRLKSRSDRGRLRCPECRQSHRSSSNWQKNFKLANIADGFRRGDRSERCPPSRSDQVHCDYCPEDASRDAKGPAAVKTCLKCEVSMCSQHVQPHLELPAFREHPLVEPLGDMRTRKCSEHDEMFRYYCLDERLFLCNACTIEGTHSGHAIKTLKNAMKDFKACLDIQLHKTNRKILKAEKNRLEQKEIERQNKAYRDDTNQHLDAFRETSVARLDAFLSSLRDCISSRDGEQCSGIQQNLSRIAQDQSRLQDVHSGVQRLLQESDAFHFIKEYNSSIKRYRRLLRKPLFVPDEVTVDTEPLFETLEGKMCEFMAELRQDAHTLLSSICEIEGGDAEEEEDEDDDDEESCDDEDEEEESEEEMRSEEEEEQQDLTDSGDEEYSPEEEEDEED